jgi:hypothetical protein
MNLWKQLPDSLKYGLLISGAILFITGVIGMDDIRAIFTSNSSDADVSQELSSQSSTVKFILTDIRDNTPISNANVVFIFDGAPEPRYTDDYGYVSITIPVRQEVKVKIQKKGYKVISRTINLTADPEKTVEYKLEPAIEDSQFRDNAQGSANKKIVEEQQNATITNEGQTGTQEKMSRESKEGTQEFSQGMVPVEFVQLYFYRTEHGLYEEAFAMLSQTYMENIYYNEGFTFDSAFENYVDFWNKCDIDYANLKEISSNSYRAVVSYDRRFFCEDDHQVGRDHSFTSREMQIVKTSSESNWQIDSVSPK